MAGGEIICGSFHGKPESGSAYPGVLIGLEKRADGKPKKTLQRLRKPFKRNNFPVEIEISISEAAVLAPLLPAYKKDLVARIGHRDWSKASNEEEEAGLNATDAQYGKGKGWQLYCITDLVRACRTSVAEKEPIHICFI